jgi:hypothetical protein
MITHVGTTNSSEFINPPAISNAVITPIVFCPSFAPWVSEKNVLRGEALEHEFLPQ